MYKKIKDSSFNKKGVVILIAFILLAILGSLSLIFIYLVQTNTSSTTNWFLRRHVQILSENGINLAMANLIKKIQNNPYLINESDILTKDSDFDYKKFFLHNVDQLVNSSIGKYKQKFLGKEHQFAILSKDDKRNFGVKVYVKDASGKINAINTSSSAFQHFFNNFTSDKKIESNINFSALYTEKFPYDLKKYFSLYPSTFNLFKYANPDSKGLDEYEKFKNYFQKSFEFENRTFININTANLDIIAYNLSGSEAVTIENTPCTIGNSTKKNEVFFEEAFNILQLSNKPLCRTNLKLKKTKKTSISDAKAKVIAEYIVQKRSQIQGWKSYKELFNSIKSDLKNRLTNDEIELTISLIHPKILLSQLHNYKNIRKSIDKTNITKGGFEFSFSSDGYFEIYSVGVIFTNNEILAQETTFKLTKLFSKEILFGYKNLKNKTAIATNVDFYPYSNVNLPTNAIQSDGFISLAKLYDFCNGEEGRVFKYTLADNTYLEKVGLYDIAKERNIINPKELSSFVIKEGMYIPPYFSLLTNIDKTMEIKLLDKQEGDMPFCSAFSSVRPYIYLLNNFGINIVFKTFGDPTSLSFEFTNGDITNFKSQILNTTLIDNNLQFWIIDYPLTVEAVEQKVNRLSESQWHMLSYYYYYKINQIKRGKPTEEKFSIFTRIDNQNINTFPKEDELYINTVFFENLFQNQVMFAVGGNLFPLTNSGILINGLCFYKTLNYYENFYTPYNKKGSIEIFNPQTGYKTITNVYYFGDKVSVDNPSETKITKIDFNFTNEDNLPILDIIEYLTFSNVQFLESY